MESLFNATQRFESDIYIGDYTHYVEENPLTHKKGVVMSNLPLNDIASLHFINHQHISVLGVNFEKNLGYFKDKGGLLASNCECMLVSDKARKRGWLILVELKYCGNEPRTVMDNFTEALSQVRDTFIYLRDVKQLFDERDYRYIWVASMPEHDELIPFSQFYPSPERLLEYNDIYHVSLICANEIEIRTHQHIRLE